MGTQWYRLKDVFYVAKIIPKNKKALHLRKGLQGRRRPTLPPGVAVPSAQTGLTSLFGMERGGPRRHGHLDLKYLNVHDMTYVGTDLAAVKKESTKYIFL